MCATGERAFEEIDIAMHGYGVWDLGTVSVVARFRVFRALLAVCMICPLLFLLERFTFGMKVSQCSGIGEIDVICLKSPPS